MGEWKEQDIANIVRKIKNFDKGCNIYNDVGQKQGVKIITTLTMSYRQ